MATGIASLKDEPLFLRIRSNISGMRFGLNEISGALGDLGTFIPLAAAISIVNGMDIGAILLFAGLFNVITGVLFGLPIPVQPMKVIAAVVIAEGLSSSETAAAGLLAGAIVFFLGATKLTEKLESVVPRAVVRGIQLGVGAKLFIKGISFVSASPVWGADSIVVAALLVAAVAISLRFAKIPTALLLFSVGLGLIVIAQPQAISAFSISFIKLQTIVPSSQDWLNGLIYGAIPQIPLTLLNSVIAVCVLSGDLFPDKRIPTSRMAISVGAMNLIGCWFGGMPLCHGSGGLAGQYRFGARSGGSVVMLGLGKIVIGLFFGVSAMWILNAYPLSVLGVLLLFAGIELAKPARDQRTILAVSVVIATGVGIVLFNTMIGFATGMVLDMIIKLRWLRS